MEYAQVKEWLDRHVRHFKEGNEISEFNSGIRAITWDDEIQMGKGIELVADIMGLNLMEIIRENNEYPYKYIFVYDGVEFSQLQKERLQGNAGKNS